MEEQGNNKSNNNRFGPFEVKDCALVAIATGVKAQNLKELRDALRQVNPGSIYFHFWGGLLRPTFDDPEFINDFAIWSHYALHDEILAERLAIIDPTAFHDLESVRQELIETIEERLDEVQWPMWASSDSQFHFIRSQIVIFNTNLVIQDPRELVELTPKMRLGSLFYHFIDSRRRTPDRHSDFEAWLQGFHGEHNELCELISRVDPYFITLRELRRTLSDTFSAYFQRKA
jgi:hypothetical protein